MRKHVQLLIVASVAMMMVIAAGAVGTVGGAATDSNELMEIQTAQADDESDLRIASFEPPALGEPGEEVTVSFEVVNDGDSTADAEVQFHSDYGFLSEEVTVEPGERESFEVTEELPDEPGVYYQLVEVGDTLWAQWVEVSEEPDEQAALRVTDTEIPGEGTAGEPESVGVTVTNLGNAPGEAHLHYGGDTASNDWSIDLEPGESKEFFLDIDIAEDMSHDHFFHLQQEGWDEPTSIVEAVTAVDLPALDDVSIEADELPEMHVHGESGVIEATIVNDGDEELELPIYYIFDGHTIDVEELHVLPDEARTVTFDIPSDLPIGIFEHGVTVGDESVMKEVSVVDEQTAERIESLEDEVDQLEDEIDQLEAELTDADVSIDVTVEPADAATFQVGGDALVSVESDDVEPSEVTVEVDGEAHTPNDGEATIPLTEPGEIDLAISYGDVTETVSLDVAQADTDDDDGLPGFGPIAGVIALLGSLFVLYRRTTTSA